MSVKTMKRQLIYVLAIITAIQLLFLIYHYSIYFYYISIERLEDGIHCCQFLTVYFSKKHHLGPRVFFERTKQ
jgi:hypothetical protein